MHYANEFPNDDDYFLRLTLIGRHFLKNLNCSELDTENLTTANEWVFTFVKVKTIPEYIFPDLSSFLTNVLLLMRKFGQFCIVRQFRICNVYLGCKCLRNNFWSIFQVENLTTISEQKKVTTQRKLVFKKHKMTTKYV